MIDGLSILLKLVVLGILLGQVPLYIRLPAATYRPLLAVWKTLRYAPGIIVTLHRRAADAISHNQIEAAILFHREALQHGLAGRLFYVPFDVYNIAAMLWRAKQPEAAAEWFVLADDCTRDDSRLKPLILIGLGSCLTLLDRYEPAESALERAAALCRDLRTAKYLRQVISARGYLAMQSERFDDALRWYEREARLPGPMERHDKLRNLNNLAAACVELGDLPKAELYIDEAQRLGGSDALPGDFYLLDTRGGLRLAQGRLSEARADFTLALTLFGPEPHTLWFLAQTAYKDGSFEEAIDYINQMPTPPPGALWRRRLADTLEGLAEFDAFAGRLEVADRRRSAADKLRTRVPDLDAATDEPLLAAARTTLSGRRFTGVSSFEILTLRAYLAGFLLFGGAILFLPDGSAGVVALEAALLTVFVAVRWPLNRLLLWPKKVAEAQQVA